MAVSVDRIHTGSAKKAGPVNELRPFLRDINIIFPYGSLSLIDTAGEPVIILFAWAITTRPGNVEDTDTIVCDEINHSM